MNVGTASDKRSIIEAGRANAEYYQDIWRFRELFYILVWRDVVVRYKQTVFGLGWTIFRPLLTALVFSLVFGRMVKVPSGGMPYAPYIYTALIPWLFLAATISDISVSLNAYAGLISKVYFPRLLAPLVATTITSIDMLISVLVLIPMLWMFHVGFSWHLLLIIPLSFLVGGLGLGLGLCFSAMNVKYRDTGLVLPYVLQFGLYLSPIIFPSSLVPEKWRLLYSFNPAVGVIEGFRWATFPNQDIHVSSIMASVLSAIVYLFLGVRYFRRMERSLADVI